MTEEERKESRRAANKRYYDSHREQERKRSRIKTKKLRKQDPERYRKYLRTYRKKHPDKVFFWSLKANYGITREQYQKILEAQGGTCAVCRQPPGKGAHDGFCVDHDHVTGRVRGVLHGRCNKGLGNFLDRPDLLRAAADYLERR